MAGLVDFGVIAGRAILVFLFFHFAHHPTYIFDSFSKWVEEKTAGQAADERVNRTDAILVTPPSIIINVLGTKNDSRPLSNYHHRISP